MCSLTSLTHPFALDCIQRAFAQNGTPVSDPARFIPLSPSRVGDLRSNDIALHSCEFVSIRPPADLSAEACAKVEAFAQAGGFPPE